MSKVRVTEEEVEEILAKYSIDPYPSLGFGVALIKAEGAPIHPEIMRVEWTWEVESDCTKEWYDKQAKHYAEYHK